MIPNTGEVKVLTDFVTDDLTLKLYSNDVIPAETDTAASYTEVSGGGYLAKVLELANWTITGGAPSQALYAAQEFSFTGITDTPGTIYGYFIVDSLGVLRGMERFSAGVVPFVSENGSLIRIVPKIQTS